MLNKKPLMATWELTLRCNANCLFCGSAAGKGRPDELTDEECYDLIDQISNLDVKLVTLLGGEPLLRKNWREIIERLTKKSIKISLITNGLLLTENDIKFLKKIKPIGVSLSLNGDPKIHNLVSGVEGYEKINSAIKLLKKHDIICGIITTLTKLNYKDRNLNYLKSFFKENDLNSWKIQIAHPTGRMTKDLCLNINDIYKLVKWISYVKKNELSNIGIGDEIGYCSSFEPILRGGDWPWRGCTAGLIHFGICSDGSIKGCLALPDNFIEGNIKNNNLKNIWFDNNNFGYNRDFDVSLLTDGCKNCDKGEKCKGGCRTYNYGYSNKLYFCNPCLYRYEKERK